MKYVLAMFCCIVVVGCNEASREAGKSSRTDVTVKKPVAEQAATSPLEQKEDRTDISITADIRKRIVDDKLSVEAQNIKIISRDGVVTLRGSVKSADEKQKIADVAGEYAGEKHVIDGIGIEA